MRAASPKLRRRSRSRRKRGIARTSPGAPEESRGLPRSSTGSSSLSRDGRARTSERSQTLFEIPGLVGSPLNRRYQADNAPRPAINVLGPPVFAGETRSLYGDIDVPISTPNRGAEYQPTRMAKSNVPVLAT